MNLNEYQTRIALAKADFLTHYKNAYENADSIMVSKQQFIVSFNNGKLFPELFKTLGVVTFQTVEKWKKKLEDAGGDIEVLAPQYNYKNSKPAQRSLTEMEKKIFIDVLLDPRKMKIGKAIAHTKFKLQNMGIVSRAAKITFRRFATDFYESNRLVWTKIREGEKKLKDKFLPYVERNAKLLEVGDVFVTDGKTTTFNIINPYTGKAQKATLIAHLDWKSKAICGWELMLSENVQAIASSLRNAILNLRRVPKVVYSDNGKAFKARFFQHSPSFEECGFYGLFGRLGIEPAFSLPYNARAKVIERVWQEFIEGGERLIPSFTGTDPVNKPAYMMRNEKFHVKLHEQRFGTDGVAITIEQAKEYIEKFLEFYHSQPCPNVFGKTIGEVFAEARELENPIQEELLDDLMMQLQDDSQPIGRNGVKLLNAHYFNSMMTQLVGDDVYVKVSIFDYSYVKVFDINGKFICRAERQEQVHPMAFKLGTVKDQQDLKEKLKLQKHAKKIADQQTKEVMRVHSGAANLLLKTGTYGATHTVELPETVSQEPIAIPESVDDSQKVKTYLDD